MSGKVTCLHGTAAVAHGVERQLHVVVARPQYLFQPDLLLPTALLFSFLLGERRRILLTTLFVIRIWFLWLRSSLPAVFL